MSKFVDRKKGPTPESVIGLPEPTLSLVAQYMGQDASADAGAALPADVSRTDPNEPSRVKARDERGTERVEPASEPTPSELVADYGKVGEHVASMLESGAAHGG